MDKVEEMALAFKALSDPLRLRILKKLKKQNECRAFCVCTLAEELGISQPNLSHHLKVLKSAGIIRCEKVGGCSYYIIDRKKIKGIFEMFENEF